MSRNDEFDADLQRTYGQERAGKGPNPRRPADFGLVQHDEVPDEIGEAYEYIGVEGAWAKNDRDDPPYGPWGTLSDTVDIAPTDELHTAQQWISGTYIDNVSAQFRGTVEPMVEDDPYTGVRIYQDSSNQRWILDGTHRVAIARQAGVPLRGRIIDSLEEPREWASEWEDD